jgi:hypothetical protein
VVASAILTAIGISREDALLSKIADVEVIPIVDPKQNRTIWTGRSIP